MKYKFLKICLLLNFSIFLKSNAQGFLLSQSCNVNVNDPATLAFSRSNIINSTFKIHLTDKNGVPSSCSGTLLNVNVSDNEMKNYILIARHCLTDCNLCTSITTDFNAIQTLYFNYQSPSALNSGTALSNEGRGIFNQSTGLNNNNYEYVHSTRLKLIADKYLGDFALIELETPIPPHFNIFYSGWNPNKFYSDDVIIGFPNSNQIPTRFVGIHHPKGDIKKISGTNSVVFAEFPAQTACYTVTTVIDVLFGWIWKRKYSTKSVCNRIDFIPEMIVPIWAYGAVEGGSSGSALFSSGNRVFGQLSGLGGDCNFPLAIAYGKFHSSYYLQAVKNALNPTNELSVDLFGMQGRKMDCFDNLTLPNIPSTGIDRNGFYFPANHYQSNNKISLKAINNITTNRAITIFSGADYEFTAGGTITLNSDFTVEQGAVFNMAHATCVQTRSSEKTDIISKLSNIKIPQYKVFDITKYYDNYKVVDKDKNIALKVFPNPTSGDMSINLISPSKPINGELVVVDMLGKVIYQLKLEQVNNLTTER